MPGKRTRDRQLAKLAARRQAQRNARARRKKLIAGLVGVVVGLASIAVGFSVLTGGEDGEPSPSKSPKPNRQVEPQQTGTVQAQATPPSEVACGAERPAAADVPKPQFDRAPSPKLVLDENSVYTAVMETSCGTIEIELRAAEAPKTVASFVFLAEKGYFDGIFFHRVADGIDVIQGGDPLGLGSGGPGYSIPDELTGSESYVEGTVAMANAGPNTGGSQFFVITGPEGTNLDLYPNYTIFGEVVSGLDAAVKINSLMEGPDHDGPPVKAAYIESVTIREEPKPVGTPSASPSA
jgi:peptidylprolyl isomerase